MIKVRREGDLYIINAGTDLSGNVIMWTTIYYYNGIVIDSGCINAASEIINAIESIGDVKAVLITHHHEDHVGAAPLFRDRGYKIYASYRTVEILRNPPVIPKYRRLVWGQPMPVEAEPINHKIRVGDLDIDVYNAPGHSPDHVIYKIRDMLFTGDLIGSLKPKIAYYGEDYLEILNTVENTVFKLDFSRILGGHITASREDIKGFTKYLIDLKNRIMDLYRQGKSIEEITNKLLSKVPEKVIMMETVSEGEWRRSYLIQSLLGLKHNK